MHARFRSEIGWPKVLQDIHRFTEDDFCLGVALINGMTLVAEAGDMTRFESPEPADELLWIDSQRVFQWREAAAGRGTPDNGRPFRQ